MTREQARLKLLSLANPDRLRRAKAVALVNPAADGHELTAKAKSRSNPERRHDVYINLATRGSECTCEDRKYRTEWCAHVCALLQMFEFAQEKEAA